MTDWIYAAYSDEMRDDWMQDAHNLTLWSLDGSCYLDTFFTHVFGA